jgi:tetratricopeptide (TPR) repeat protein
MTTADTQANAIAAELARLAALYAGGPAPDAKAQADCLALCRQALEHKRADAAIPLLDLLHRHAPDDVNAAQLLGFALHGEQRLVEAEAIFAAIVAGAPRAPGPLFGLAQTRYELGLPAAAVFAQAQVETPDNLDIVRNRAAAMAAEGDVPGAEALLTATLHARPGWLGGHKGLATLLWTRGDQGRFAASYAAACAAEPKNAELWLSWFRAVAQTRDWAAARAILDDAALHLGETPPVLVSRLFVASEAGDVATADALFAKTHHIQGDTINLCRIRHFIRQRRLDEAEAVAVPQLLSPTATLYWPYLSIIWRLMDDARHLWLDRPEETIKACAVDLSAAEFAELADVLRALHSMDRPYVEQSVRGGTQTDRSIILRHEPILQRTRVRWMDAIRAYVADLPAFEQGHPLLGCPRDDLLVEGSWSVRLLKQGRNVPHTHALGWLSTAFYIALPDAAQMGPAPAGHIAFGTPPEELGVDLPPYRTITPKVGETAVFPSTMWHSTLPFNDGERLVMALDVRRPGR